MLDLVYGVCTIELEFETVTRAGGHHQITIQKVVCPDHLYYITDNGCTPRKP